MWDSKPVTIIIIIIYLRRGLASLLTRASEAHTSVISGNLVNKMLSAMCAMVNVNLMSFHLGCNTITRNAAFSDLWTCLLRHAVVYRGRVLEQGTHTELMAAKGYYTHLVEMSR